MAYAQWVTITITTKDFTASIKNAKLAWGKFYKNGNKDDEISADKVNELVIAPGSSATIYSCGRSDVGSGTEGSFDIYDGQTHVGNYYWECPWGSKTNTSTWAPSSDAYIAQVTGANLSGGALGNVTIKVVKL